MENKTCKKCGSDKPQSDFGRDKSRVDGYSYVCKVCKNRYNKTYYNLNTEAKRDYYLENREGISNNNKAKYYENKTFYSNKNRKYRNNRLKNDPLFKLRYDIKGTIRDAFRSKNKVKVGSSLDILGCSIIEFKAHLEAQFEPWMNWDNKGLYNGELNYGWDIDHIIPTSSAITEEDIIRLNHYTNLQPLCSYINRYEKRGNVLC